MELANNNPLVSVAVITYNSSQYVIETLESVRQQTYDNIELIISDDCSSDNTIELCTKWTEQHKARFSNIKIVQSPANTGQSGNYNRAFDACTGEWIKEIDGDDKLLPNCISDFLDYTIEHPDAKYIFGKINYIGGDDATYRKYREIFNYDFFSWPTDQQLEFLIFNRNCIPSPASFYSHKYIKTLGFKNDERIPLMEDWPKWIKLIQLGAKFHFMGKEVVSYRVNSGISTPSTLSIDYFKSNVLFYLLYRYPVWVMTNEEKAALRMADFICEQYKSKLASENEVKRLRNTYAYRIGKCILALFPWLKKRDGK